MMINDQDIKPSLPPLSKMISPIQSPISMNLQNKLKMENDTDVSSSSINHDSNKIMNDNQSDLSNRSQTPTQQTQTLNQIHSTQTQPPLYYPAANNPVVSESTVLRSLNDYPINLPSDKSNVIIQRNLSAQSQHYVYSPLNQLKHTNDPQSLNPNLPQRSNSPSQFPMHSTTPFQLETIDSNEYMKHRQSPLIPNYYQNFQASKVVPAQYDFQQQMINGMPFSITQQNRLLQQPQQFYQQQQQQQTQQHQQLQDQHQHQVYQQQQQMQEHIQQQQHLQQQQQQQYNNYMNAQQNQNNVANVTPVVESVHTIPEKCVCKQNDAARIPRPRNAFILFRQKNHQSLIEEGNEIKTNPEVSRELGRRWKELDPVDKEYWNKLAEEEKRFHAEKYPGYKYTPKRNSKKKCDFCVHKQKMKEQMAQKAAQRRAQKEQKRLEKHYQQQLMQLKQQQQKQRQQQQLLQKQQKQQQKELAQQQLQAQQQVVSHDEHTLDQQKNLHAVQPMEFANQYANPTAQNHLFADMNLTNYQKFTQQIQQLRTPLHSATNSLSSNNNSNSNASYYTPGMVSHFSNDNNSSVVNSVHELSQNGTPIQRQESPLINNMPPQFTQAQQIGYQNIAVNPNSYRVPTSQPQQNHLIMNSSNSVGAITSTSATGTTGASSIYTNHLSQSRPTTPFDFPSYNYEHNKEDQKQHLENLKNTYSIARPDDEINVKIEDKSGIEVKTEDNSGIDVKIEDNSGIDVKIEDNSGIDVKIEDIPNTHNEAANSEDDSSEDEDNSESTNENEYKIKSEGNHEHQHENKQVEGIKSEFENEDEQKSEPDNEHENVNNIKRGDDDTNRDDEGVNSENENGDNESSQINNNDETKTVLPSIDNLSLPPININSK